MKEPKTYTARGFGIWDAFKDYNGREVRVQESSIATKACAWVFVSELPEAKENGDGGAIHLTLKTSRQLRKALKAWERSEHR